MEINIRNLCDPEKIPVVTEEEGSVSNPTDHIIHIKTEDADIEMKKSEFFLLCCGLIFANEQLHYIKDSNDESFSPEEFPQSSRLQISEIEFLRSVTEGSNNYLLLGDFVDDADIYKNGSGVNLLVRKDSINVFGEHLFKAGFRRCAHPYGRYSGYSLDKKLSEFQRWENHELKMAVNIYSELSCMSLLPKTWICLSDNIQAYAWSNAVYDKKYGIYRIDMMTETLYILVRCIFFLKCFPELYTDILNERNGIIDTEDFRSMVRDVFYGFGDELIKLIKNKEYDIIINKYITYKNY